MRRRPSTDRDPVPARPFRPARRDRRLAALGEARRDLPPRARGRRRRRSAVRARVHAHRHRAEIASAVLWIAIFAVVGVSKAIGLYDRDELLIGKGTLNEVPGLFQLATLYTLIMTMVASAQSAPFALQRSRPSGRRCSSRPDRPRHRRASSAARPPARSAASARQRAAGRWRSRASSAHFETAHAERRRLHLPFERFELERPPRHRLRPLRGRAQHPPRDRRPGRLIRTASCKPCATSRSTGSRSA